MNAEAQSFADIVGNDKYLLVPFFQRGYVWKEDNWDELLENLLGENEHFLGSVIFKVDHTYNGELIWSVIDGQQRLTTLSVLFDVCCKILSRLHFSGNANGGWNQYEHKRQSLLFFDSQQGHILKLRHSRVDIGAYETAVSGRTDQPIHSRQIEKCESYFMDKLKDTPADAERIFGILKGNDKILVSIWLGQGDREQTIFDTINTAGVRLTAADTIKNLIFQRMIDVGGHTNRERVERIYDSLWDVVFNGEEQDYWAKEHKQGRINRITLETMLHCVAVVERFYDPNRHSTGDLANCYKEYIANRTLDELEAFVKKIADYAKYYKEFFWDEEDTGHMYEFGNVCDRTLNILRACDTTTFDPLVLKLMTENPPLDDGTISPFLEKSLDEIARYVLLHVVCGESVKNFNKECFVVISGNKSITDYTVEKVEAGKISTENIRTGLRRITKNGLAKCILFWLELKWMSLQNVLIKQLQYNSSMTLEHVMPQSWGKNWPITKPQTVSPETGESVSEISTARELRASAVYEIGNMALLSSKLNSTIRDGSIKDKVEGTNGKPGVAALASQIHYTKEVVDKVQGNNYVWNEKTIRDRTNELTEEFLAMWGLGDIKQPQSASNLSINGTSAESSVNTEDDKAIENAGTKAAHQESTVAQCAIDGLKVSAIAKSAFPALFTENRITDADIAFLQSENASNLFKTNHYQVLKESVGDVAVEVKDAHGRNRFYSKIVLKHGEKLYLLTSQWRSDGKAALITWLAEHGIDQNRIVALCMPQTVTAKVLAEYEKELKELVADLNAGKIKSKLPEGRFVMEEERYDKVADGKVDREWVLLTRGQLKRSVGIKTVRLYRFDGTLKPKTFMRWEVSSVRLEGEYDNGVSGECDVAKVPDGFEPQAIVIHLGKRIG